MSPRNIDYLLCNFSVCLHHPLNCQLYCRLCNRNFIPKSGIQSSQSLQMMAFSELSILTLTDWQSEVYPPGMCSTSMPSCWIEPTVDGIMWHWYESNTSSGKIFPGAVAMKSLKSFSTHSSIALSFIQAFSGQ